MTTYESKSIGWWLFVLAGSFGVFGIVIAVGMGVDGDLGAPIGFLVVALGIFVASFGVLTVRVDNSEVAWRFGVGPFGRRIAFDRIRGVEARRTPWYWGWGIRWTSSGWLWRATGLDVVWLELDNGRSIGVGTEDPQGLVRAIQKNLDRDR